jgi:hypothetical protein
MGGVVARVELRLGGYARPVGGISIYEVAQGMGEKWGCNFIRKLFIINMIGCFKKVVWVDYGVSKGIERSLKGCGGEGRVGGWGVGNFFS